MCQGLRCMVRTEPSGGKVTLSSSTPRGKAITSTHSFAASASASRANGVLPLPRILVIICSEPSPTLTLPGPPPAPEKAASCREQHIHYSFDSDATNFHDLEGDHKAYPYYIHSTTCPIPSSATRTHHNVI